LSQSVCESIRSRVSAAPFRSASRTPTEKNRMGNRSCKHRPGSSRRSGAPRLSWGAWNILRLGFNLRALQRFLLACEPARCSPTCSVFNAEVHSAYRGAASSSWFATCERRSSSTRYFAVRGKCFWNHGRIAGIQVLLRNLRSPSNKFDRNVRRNDDDTTPPRRLARILRCDASQP
jgi:hypothetical protein